MTEPIIVAYIVKLSELSLVVIAGISLGPRTFDGIIKIRSSLNVLKVQTVHIIRLSANINS